MLQRERKQFSAQVQSAGCPSWVKTGNTRSDQMTSALPPKADSSRTSREVRNVPIAEAGGLLRSPRRRSRGAPGGLRGCAFLTFWYSKPIQTLWGGRQSLLPPAPHPLFLPHTP